MMSYRLTHQKGSAACRCFLASEMPSCVLLLLCKLSCKELGINEVIGRPQNVRKMSHKKFRM